MARIERATLETDLPTATARAHFSSEARRILKGWHRRRRIEVEVKARRKKPSPPWDNSRGYLRREVYRLVRLFDELGHAEAIKAIVVQRGVPRSPSYEENKFHWGFLALESHPSTVLNPHERRLFANQLLYADRHEVPEVHLIGFIYQLGSKISIFDRVANPRLALLARATEA